jgi:hypothetical protein
MPEENIAELVKTINKKLNNLEVAYRELMNDNFRLKAVHEIQNIMGLYHNYHTAGMQEETVALYAQHTPGTSVQLATTGIWEGIEGVKKLYIGMLGTYEGERIGRLYEHDLTTPVIEVAEDMKTAKAQWTSPGMETHYDPKTGKLKSLWCWGKYSCDFIVEDGKWKIWHMRWYTTIMTPFEGNGWTETGAWLDFEKKFDTNQFAPSSACPDGGDDPYDSRRNDYAINRLLPKPPLPYITWSDTHVSEKLPPYLQKRKK